MPVRTAEMWRSTVAACVAIRTTVALSTGCNDQGGGNTIYFDRHVLECSPGSALANFHYATYECTSGNARFEYGCSPVAPTTTTANSYSNVCTDQGAGDTVFLDRQNVQCPTDMALTRVHLNPCSSSQLRYDYKCIPLVGTVTSLSTSCNDKGAGHTIFLDRHPVTCPSGSVLTGFHLQPCDASNIRYDFNCVSIPSPPPPPLPPRPPAPPPLPPPSPTPSPPPPPLPCSSNADCPAGQTCSAATTAGRRLFGANTVTSTGTGTGSGTCISSRRTRRQLRNGADRGKLRGGEHSVADVSQAQQQSPQKWSCCGITCACAYG